MAHLDYSQRFEEGRISALISALGRLSHDWWQARAARQASLAQQWEDRQAFNTLLGKEDWVLDDMGVHRGDVEYLANQPLHINAAIELEKIRAHSMQGR
ncbi:MAG: hypothetical protein AAFY99_05440 [Pseudomonadota bacterium]